MPVVTAFTPLSACDVPSLPAQWADCYVAFLQSVYAKSGSLSTYQSCHGLVRRFLSGLQASPVETTREDILAFIDAPTASTNVTRLDVLRRFFSYAIECGLYTSPNPTFDIKVSRKPKAARPPVPRAFADESAWGRCLAQFLQSLMNISQSRATVRTYTSLLSLFFSESADGGPPKSPSAYTREDILSFLHHRVRSNRNRGAEPSPSTTNMRLAAISSFYTFASQYSYTDADGQTRLLYDHASPTAGLHTGKVARRYRAFSKAELVKLFGVIPDNTVQGVRDRAIFTAYLHSARRRMEIAALRWGDLEQRMITDADGTHRLATLYRFRGKGSSTVEDIAEFPPVAKLALDAYLEKSGRRETMQADSPLFTSTVSKRGKALSATYINQLLKNYVKKAGLDAKRLTLHSFRHTSVQIRHEAGQDLLEIQRLLRHRSLATTQVYLLGLQPIADRGAKLLEAAFAGLNL